MKIFFLASILLVGIIETNAQTIILTSEVPSTSTLGAGSSVVIGPEAGNLTSTFTGSSNSIIGFHSGKYITSGSANTFIGGLSGHNTTTGSMNTFIGSYSGHNNNTGMYNVYIGQSTAAQNTAGNSNTFVGRSAGYISTGNNNTALGAFAGLKAGNQNVFIGYYAGFNETGSNKLYIDNSNTSTPLIWGDFANDQLKFNGNVSIGTQLTPGGYKLAVGGKIIAEELKIQLQSSPWPDYVFSSDYKLPTLEEVEKQIKEKGHLVNVPSACEIEENGFEVGNMTVIQQEKIEELTLYIIEQNKINEKQNTELEKQRKEIEELKIAIQSLLEKKQ